MPLKQSGSHEAQGENISRLVKEGYPQKQAVAISFDVKRKNDMDDKEKLDMIVSKTDALTARFDAFNARRKARFDSFEEASHPRNAGGVFTTGEGEEAEKDTQMEHGKLSKRDPL